jgi:3-oxoacyl-(acyl-carrier-protein) synthase
MDLSEKCWKAHRVEIHSGQPLAKNGVEQFRMHSCGAVTSAIASYLGLGFDFTTTISTACSSAANAIMLGARMIASGEADTVVAGGTDALTNFTINGFNSLMIYSGSPCRPFSPDRDGLNLGEGAGYLVLSKDPEGALCEISGWANVNEAFHQTGSSPEGDGPFSSMTLALKKAGLEPSDVDYINTHGTATVGNDASEMAAMKRVFGEKIPRYGSVKNLIGHTLAASEGIEACYCAASLAGLTSAWGEPDNILSNAFGFSGNQTSLVFSKAGRCNQPESKSAEIQSVTLAESAISPQAEPDYKEAIPNANLRRRMSHLIKMGVAAGLDCLRKAGMTGSDGKLLKPLDGIITATSLGFLSDSIKMEDAIIDQEERMLNPQPFMQSTFNTVGGQIALLLGSHCYNMTYVHGTHGFDAAMKDARLLLSEGAERVLVGWFEERTPESDVIMHGLGLVPPEAGARFILLGK